MLSKEAKIIQGLFQISTKEGPRVPFKLNTFQLWLDEMIHDPDYHSFILAKPRQKGGSSYIEAILSTRCLGKIGTRAVVMSHEGEATQRLLDKVHFYLKYTNPLPAYDRNSRNELAFGKTDSTFYIGTAGARAFGRGDTITDLHASEYAYWIDAVKHSVGLFQAVPASGFKILESTGNGRNNDFHYIWQHAKRMGYKRLFAPWFIDLEYSRRLPYADWSLRDADTQHLTYLINMQKKFNLSLEQMFWYVCKLAELRDDLHLMQQEYPSEPEECFQATSGSVFPDVELTPSKAWQDILRFNTRMFGLPDHPKPNLHYTFGGDPSGGTGHDDAALVAFCVETFEQVLRFSSNTTDPVIFAKLLMDLGRHYNHAYLVTESNNHGAAVIPILKRDYDRSLLYYYKRATTKSPAKYGWLNSQQHKQELVGGMQEMLDQYTFYDKKTVEEFQKFEEDVEGKMGAKSDNLVIAGGLGMLGCMKQIRFRTDYLTPPPPLKEKPSSYMYYTLDEALKSIEVQQRGSGYFKPQIRIGEIWPSA